MSRNFELLLELGGDDELFGPQNRLSNADSLAGKELLPELDKKMRRVILQNALLPDIMEVSEEPTSAETADPQVRPAQERGRKSLWDESLNDPFASLSHLTADTATIAPAGDPLTGVPQQDPESQSAQQSVIETVPSFAPLKSRAGLWIDSIKVAAAKWTHSVRERNGLQAAEREATIREEERKLVQRIFPGTATDSTRAAVFSGLDKECQCAPVCARAAEVLAARGEGPVCVVDANFESPSLHEHFGKQNTKGLAEAILEKKPIKQYVHEIGGPGLCLMPAGSAPLQLAGAEIADRLRNRIAEARATFWYVIIRAGYLAPESIGILTSRATEGVVLVVDANCTRRDSAKRVKENLVAANVNVLGVVLINYTHPVPKFIYRML